jgi:hypothetical protein
VGKVASISISIHLAIMLLRSENSIAFDFIAAVLICKTNATINNIHLIEVLKPFHY